MRAWDAGLGCSGISLGSCGRCLLVMLSAGLMDSETGSRLRAPLCTWLPAAVCIVPAHNMHAKVPQQLHH